MNVTVEDAGKYKVTAKNELGESSASISLNFDSESLYLTSPSSFALSFYLLCLHLLLLFLLSLTFQTRVEQGGESCLLLHLFFSSFWLHFSLSLFSLSCVLLMPLSFLFFSCNDFLSLGDPIKSKSNRIPAFFVSQTGIYFSYPIAFPPPFSITSCFFPFFKLSCSISSNFHV